jgi:hypothetical protein
MIYLCILELLLYICCLDSTIQALEGSIEKLRSHFTCTSYCSANTAEAANFIGFQVSNSWEYEKNENWMLT